MVNYTIMIVGNGGVGKTTFIQYCQLGVFERMYKSTFGVIAYTCIVGLDTLTIIDTAGQEMYSTIRYNEKIDGLIIMYNPDDKITCDNVSYWYAKLVKTYGHVPTVLCGNIRYPLNTKAGKLPLIKTATHSMISTKSGHNCDEPFTILIKQMTRNLI